MANLPLGLTNLGRILKHFIMPSINILTEGERDSGGVSWRASTGWFPAQSCKGDVFGGSETVQTPPSPPPSSRSTLTPTSAMMASTPERRCRAGGLGSTILLTDDHNLWDLVSFSYFTFFWRPWYPTRTKWKPSKHSAKMVNNSNFRTKTCIFWWWWWWRIGADFYERVQVCFFCCWMCVCTVLCLLPPSSSPRQQQGYWVGLGGTRGPALMPALLGPPSPTFLTPLEDNPELSYTSKRL